MGNGIREVWHKGESATPKKRRLCTAPLKLAIVKACVKLPQSAAGIARQVGSTPDRVATMLAELLHRGHVEKVASKFAYAGTYRTTPTGATWALEQIEKQKAED